MGNFFIQGEFDRLFSTLPKRKFIQILIVGLDGGGKTTLCNTIKPNQVKTKTPTIGFNVEEVNFGDKISCFNWDVCGETKLSSIRNFYFKEAKGLIYVIDANDRKRILKNRQALPSAIEEFERNFCKKALYGIPILFFLNKQDLQNSINVLEFMDLKDMKKIFKFLNENSNNYFVQSCCGLTKDGVYEGFEWLINQIKNEKPILLLKRAWKNEQWTFRNHPIYPKSIKTAVWGLLLFSEKRKYVCKDVFQHIIQFIPIEIRNIKTKEIQKLLEKYKNFMKSKDSL